MIAAKEHGFEPPAVVGNDSYPHYDTSDWQIQRWCNMVVSETDAREKPRLRYNHDSGQLEPVAA